MAETNIRETLTASTFGLKEKQEYYKKKWMKEHIWTIVLAVAIWLFVIITISIKGVPIFLVSAIGGLLAVMQYTLLYNRMRAYVEDRAFGH